MESVGRQGGNDRRRSGEEPSAEGGSAADLAAFRRRAADVARGATEAEHAEPVGGQPGMSETKTVEQEGAAEHDFGSDSTQQLDRLGRALRDARAQNKAMRTRMEDFVRASSDWVWETDSQGTITYVSERIGDLLGLPPASIRGQELFRILTVVEQHRERFHEALHLRQPFRGIVAEAQDRMGHARRCEVSGIPVFNDATGRFEGYRGAGSDVTRQYEADQALKRSEDMLRQALEELKGKNLQLEIALAQAESSVKAKTEFLANMSHELRTPLNAILGFSEILERETFGALGDSRYKGYVRNVLESGHHLLDIINDLLDMAKVESGHLEMNEESVDLGELVGSCMRLMSEQASAHKLRLSSNVSRDRFLLWADGRLVKQMVLNLMSNAIKFTSEGGTVAVDARRMSEGRLAVSVADTGVGIEPQDIERALAPFGQVDAAMTRAHEGTGLGLPLVKAMIELHDGEFILNSTPGEGTTATIVFPNDRLMDDAEED